MNSNGNDFCSVRRLMLLSYCNKIANGPFQKSYQGCQMLPAETATDCMVRDQRWAINFPKRPHEKLGLLWRAELSSAQY